MLPKHLIKDQLNQKRIKVLEDWSKILLNFLVPNCVWLKQIFTWGVTETCKGKERTCSNILIVLKPFMHAFSIKWVSEWSLLLKTLCSFFTHLCATFLCLECRKLLQMASYFQKFSGGACHRTPLEARAFGAHIWCLLLYSNSPATWDIKENPDHGDWIFT